MIVESGILPKGALQFIAGSTGDLLDHLTGQDVVSFTGSADTSEKLRNHPAISRNAVRFIAERDSLNAAVLGPDAVQGTPEFDIFVKEVAREMTVKAGQKCTAIRRVLVPRAQEAAVTEALKAALGKAVPGDPRLDETRMGAACLAFAARLGCRGDRGTAHRGGDRLRPCRHRGRRGRLLRAGAAALRPAAEGGEGPLGGSLRPGLDADALRHAGRGGRTGEEGRGQPGRLRLHL